jgi:hypothetical protein
MRPPETALAESGVDPCQSRSPLAPLGTLTVLVLAAMIGGGAVAKASTVGYWRFEGTPDTAAVGPNSVLDSSGNGLNATPLGGPVYSSDVAPEAAGVCSSTSIHLNGTNQQILLPDSPTLELTHSLTIEAFVKVDEMAPFTGGSGDILFRGDNRVGLDPYKLVVTRSGELVFHVESATAAATLTCPMPYHQWTHVAGTLDDATGQMKLYLNGNVVASRITSVRPFGPLDPAYKPGLGIGSDQDSQYAELFNGWIDELRVSDVALEPTQLLIHHPRAILPAPNRPSRDWNAWGPRR